MRFCIFCLTISVLCLACSNLETIENRDDSGTLTEKFSRRKGTFAKEGKYTSYYPNGKVFEESSYKNDTLVGERKLYFESGQLQSVEHYENGIFSGKAQRYHENGQLSNEGEYADNAMTGLWKRWYDTGELQEEVHFENNEENGPFKLYHKTGKVAVEGIYTDGDNEVGEVKKYNENGELTERMFCHFGACATVWSQEKGDIAIDSARIKELGELRKRAGEND